MIDTHSIAANMPDRMREWLGRTLSIDRAGTGSLKPENAISDPRRALQWATNTEPAIRDLLKLVITTRGTEPFQSEQLAAVASKTGRWTGLEVRLILEKLRQDGILFAIRNRWGDSLLMLPVDMFVIWMRLLLPLQIPAIPAEQAKSISTEALPYKPPLSQELMRGWGIIRRYGVPFTSRGTPAKASLTRLIRVIGVSSEWLAPFIQGKQGDLPPQAAFIIEMGFVMGFLQYTSNGLTAVPDENACIWLDLPAVEAEALLAERLTRHSAGTGRALHYAGEALRRLDTDVWYKVADITDQMPDAETKTALAPWMKSLVSFGWAEYGSTTDGAVFRWTIVPDWEKAKAQLPTEDCMERIDVLPDLEIIVPPEVRQLTRWTLEALAERQKSDVVAVYRLTPASCAQASVLGYTASSAIAELQHCSRDPLPEEVASALRDWLGPGERPKEAAGVNTPTSPLPRIGKNQKADYNAGIFYELDPSPPVRLPDVLAGGPDIPPVWLKAPRIYHASTRRELIERAIGWRTSLHLRYRENWLRFIPEELEAANEDWSVSGMALPLHADTGSGKGMNSQVVTLAADDIAEIAMELPPASYGPQDD